MDLDHTFCKEKRDAWPGNGLLCSSPEATTLWVIRLSASTHELHQSLPVTVSSLRRFGT